MRKVAILFLFVLLGTVVYVRFRPELVYFAGRLSVRYSQIGEVSGSSIFKLDVPYHRQEHALSCEIASLKMALGGVGSDISESDLIASLPFDGAVKQNGFWGDPYQGFVGDIDGQMISTGYGVYWDPIAKVGLRHKRTEVIRNGSLPQLLYHINQKRPVVVWGYYGRGNAVNWLTPLEKPIKGINGEHARVLIGYSGSSTHPESLILLDPIYGEIHWSVDQFLENWGALDSSAVVVYPNPRWVKAEGSNVVWELSEDATSRRGLAMTWDEFIQQGGVGEGIHQVSSDWLRNIEIEEPLLVLDI